MSVCVLDGISSWDEGMAVMRLNLEDLEADKEKRGVKLVLKCISEIWGGTKPTVSE